MKKRKINVLFLIILTLIVLLLLLYITIKQGENRNNKNNTEIQENETNVSRPSPQEELKKSSTKLKEEYQLDIQEYSKTVWEKDGSLLTHVEDLNFDLFDGYDIDVHGLYDDKVFISLQVPDMSYITEFRTVELGYIDLITNNYVVLKEIKEQVRIWDYVVNDDSLYYSQFSVEDEFLLTSSVILEQKDEKTIIDTVSLQWFTDSPVFLKHRGEIYYSSTNVTRESETVRFRDISIKKINGLETETLIVESCKETYLPKKEFPEGNCFKTFGSPLKTDELIYLSVFNENNTKLLIFNSKSDEVFTVSTNVLASGTAYLPQNDSLIFNVEPTEFGHHQKIVVYNTQNQSIELVLYEKNFGRPVTNDNYVMFVSSPKELTTIGIFDMTNRKYLFIKNTSGEILGYPKIYIQDKTAIVVWANVDNVIIQKYQLK